jgi:hypothetical protein
MHKKRAKLVNKKNKQLYKEQELNKLQGKFKNNTSRNFYEGISKIRAGFRPRKPLCKNKHGISIVCEKSILHDCKVLLNPLEKGIAPQ